MTVFIMYLTNEVANNYIDVIKQRQILQMTKKKKCTIFSIRRDNNHRCS